MVEWAQDLMGAAEKAQVVEREAAARELATAAGSLVEVGSTAWAANPACPVALLAAGKEKETPVVDAEVALGEPEAGPVVGSEAEARPEGSEAVVEIAARVRAQWR